MPCFDVLRVLLYLLVRTCQYHAKYQTTHYTRFVHSYYVAESLKMHPQLRSAGIYIAQQRSAVRWRAVPCLALRFAVLCRAALFFLSSIYSNSTRCHTGTRYLYIRVVYSYFFFVQLIVLSQSPCFPPPANYTCTADQNVTSRSTQHSAGQLALRHLLASTILKSIFLERSRSLTKWKRT